MVVAMEIQEGFKQTEVGIIPSDWEVELLGNIGSFKKGKNIPKSMLQSNGVPCVLYGEIYTKYNSHCSRLISKITIETAKNATEMKYGDILFAGSGETAEDIGKCFTYSGSEEAYAGGDVIVFTPKDSDPIFLGFLLNSVNVNKQKAFMGQGSSVFHIYSSNLKNLIIPLPPTKTEQTAIATALNDADALITQLEQLIAKKRAIKQGAMQELLDPMVNGELRMVNDFNSAFTTQHSPFLKKGWEVKKLGEIFEITAGGDYKKEFSSNTKDDYHIYPIYSNSLSNKGLYGYCTYFSNEPYCITVTARGTIGYSCYRDHSFTAIGRLLVLKPKKPVDCFYFSEYINSKIEFILEVTGVPQLTAPQISQYKVGFPKAKAEQTRIAQILSDMDAEIEALEKKLNKYKMIKQGMMQNLLTGRIRLV